MFRATDREGLRNVALYRASEVLRRLLTVASFHCPGSRTPQMMSFVALHNRLPDFWMLSHPPLRRLSSAGFLQTLLYACKTTHRPSRRLFRRFRIVAVLPFGRTSSLGVAKDASSSFPAAESTPGRRFPGVHRKKGCGPFFLFRPWVFSTLRRFAPPQSGRLVASDIRS